MNKIRKLLLDFIIIVLVLALVLAVQFHLIGRLVLATTDEGVYLYAAKLIAKGYLPFRDFRLVQSPFLIYLSALALTIIKFNLNIFHYLYTTWVFSAIIPIYLIILDRSKSRFGAILGVLLFCTFTEMVQWDAHFFALRQASMPFLAWGIYFLKINKRYFLAGLSLAFFSLSILSNFFIVVFLVFADFIDRCKEKWGFREYLNHRRNFLLTLAIIFVVILGAFFFIPGSFDGMVRFQLVRPKSGLEGRFAWLLDSFFQNSPFLLFGLAGILAAERKNIFYSLTALGAIFSVLFLSNAFLSGYITVWAVPLALTGGLALASLYRIFKPGLYLALALSFLIFFWKPYGYLKFNLMERTTPKFFETVEILKESPGPLFALQPIYALYAGKDLTFHPDVSDMRHFEVLGENLTEEQYLDILDRSQSVLLEGFSKRMLPTSILDRIPQSFQKIYDNTDESVYVRI